MIKLPQAPIAKKVKMAAYRRAANLFPPSSYSYEDIWAYEAVFDRLNNLIPVRGDK